MSGGADQWIRWTTTGCVGLLALMAGSVSYLHAHLLVESHGQPGWIAALTPLSVDGMIVAASTTLLTDSLAGKRGGVLPWALLAVEGRGVEAHSLPLTFKGQSDLASTYASRSQTAQPYAGSGQIIGDGGDI